MVLKTHGVSIEGTDRAQKMVQILVKESCWFAVDPCPDDNYYIEVKVDRKPSLDKALNETSCILTMD